MTRPVTHYEHRGVTLCCHKPASTFGGWRNSGHAFTIDRAKVTCPGAPKPPAFQRPADEDPPPNKYRDLTCGICGDTFTTNTTGGVKYCGTECRRAAVKKRKQELREKAGAS